MLPVPRLCWRCRVELSPSVWSFPNRRFPKRRRISLLSTSLKTTSGNVTFCWRVIPTYIFFNHPSWTRTPLSVCRPQWCRLVYLHFAENGTVTSAHPEPVSWTSGLYVRAGLHQATESALQQLRNETSDTVLIENNGVAPDWGCNPFFAELWQRWCWRLV